MKASKFKRATALLADIMAAYLFANMVLAITAPPFHCSNISYIWYCIGTYWIICHLFFGCSLFQHLLHLRIEGGKWRYLALKVGAITLMPVLFSLPHRLLYIRFWDWLYKMTDYEIYGTNYDVIWEENSRLLCASVWFLLLMLAECVCLIRQRKSLCEQWGRATVSVSNRSTCKPVYFGLLGILIFLLVYEPVRMHSIRQQYGFKAYNAMPVFPPTPLIQKQRYTKDFRKRQQQPETFMKQLFEKYDLVFLVEREHPDRLQWDYFSHIILNERFAETVSDIYVELINCDMQDSLDTFLRSDYPTDSAREKAAAHIIRQCPVWPTWFSRGIFDFIIRAQQFNATHDSLHQFRVHGCNIANVWDEMENDPEIFWNQMRKRDSIMAANLANGYRQQLAKHPEKRKALLIFNQIHCIRHSGYHTKYLADYTEEHFPGKVGTLYQPSSDIGSSHKTHTYPEGRLWYSAAKEVGDFFVVPIKGSVLEEKRFTNKTAPHNWKQHTMGSLFDGILFAGHPQDYVMDENGYPFMFDPEFEKEFAHRCELSGLTDWIQESLDIYYGKTPPHDTHNMTHVYFNRIYIMVNFIVVSMLLLTLIFFGKQMLKVNTTPVAEKP
ncbi:MAG: hypothetical protein J6X35_08675 [Bacteroidales bacterium]|nr:hypothetical protein [Bacteroidales bacterium]